MSTDETYDGWTNRETWAVALHINNDQGWQESVHEALRPVASDAYRGLVTDDERSRTAGEVIRGNVEDVLDPFPPDRLTSGQWLAIQDIGSMWRVNWEELGASFLSDLDES